MSAAGGKQKSLASVQRRRLAPLQTQDGSLRTSYALDAAWRLLGACPRIILL